MFYSKNDIDVSNSASGETRQEDHVRQAQSSVIKTDVTVGLDVRQSITSQMFDIDELVLT